MTESKWGKNIRGYSSFGIHLRFAHSASEQLAAAEWIFQTQHVQTPERSDPQGLICRSRQTYRVSTVFKSSAISSRHQPRGKNDPTSLLLPRLLMNMARILSILVNRRPSDRLSSALFLASSLLRFFYFVPNRSSFIRRIDVWWSTLLASTAH